MPSANARPAATSGVIKDTEHRRAFWTKPSGRAIKNPDLLQSLCLLFLMLPACSIFCTKPPYIEGSGTVNPLSCDVALMDLHVDAIRPQKYTARVEVKISRDGRPRTSDSAMFTDAKPVLLPWWSPIKDIKVPYKPDELLYVQFTVTPGKGEALAGLAELILNPNTDPFRFHVVLAPFDIDQEEIRILHPQPIIGGKTGIGSAPKIAFTEQQLHSDQLLIEFKDFRIHPQLSTTGWTAEEMWVFHLNPQPVLNTNPNTDLAFMREEIYGGLPHPPSGGTYQTTPFPKNKPCTKGQPLWVFATIKETNGTQVRHWKFRGNPVTPTQAGTMDYPMVRLGSTDG